MYSILLTDDEKLETESLKIILTKNFMEEVSIFTANSGSKALEVVRNQKIDIVFMDIQMPGLNGLETISLIKQINPNIIVIILSAYNQFQYAQQALNLGAFKYLTKPVNRNLIVQTVRNAMSVIDSMHQNLTDNIELHEKLSTVSTMVESDFIYSCIFNNKTTDFSDYLSYFGIENSFYYICAVEFPNKILNKRQKIYDELRDVFSSKCKCIIGSLMENKVVIFLYVQRDFEIKSLMEEIFLLLSTRISSAVKIGVSNLFSDISASHTAYNNSISAINSCGVHGGVSYYKSQISSAFEAENARKLSEVLVAKLYAEDIASVKSLCTEYIAALFATYADLDKIRNSLFETLLNIKNAVLKVDASYKNDAFESIFPSLARFSEQEDFEAYLSSRAVECFLAISESKKSSENPVIKKACKFIEEHLAEDFGLEVLAQELGVSPYHLSRLFKEEKGENFINYVTSLRLEKAKKLLGEPSLIIKEISTGVGYSDQNYFTKLFKQKFGVTPSEYRETLGK